MRRLVAVLVACGLVAAALLAFGPSLPLRDFLNPERATETPVLTGGSRQVFVLPEDGADALLDELDAAVRTIDITVYLITSDEVVAAIQRATDRDVAVRVLLEPDPFGGTGEVEEETARVRAAGAEVRFSGSDVRFNHVKVLIIDGHVALITTLNLTRSALERNRELGVITDDPDDVRAAIQIFEADWGGEEVDEPGPLVVSPLNSRETFRELIGSARTSIDIYAEVIRDEEMIELLRGRARDGVAVRVLVPDEVAPDDEGVYRQLRDAGVVVRPMSHLYQHAKMILVDGERAFVGSVNFTATSMDDNREVGLVLTEAASIARLTAVFEGDWAQAAASDTNRSMFAAWRLREAAA